MGVPSKVVSKAKATNYKLAMPRDQLLTGFSVTPWRPPPRLPQHLVCNAHKRTLKIMHDNYCLLCCVVSGSDFRVSSAPTLRPCTTRADTVQIAFEIDSTALEPRESFQLRLLPANTISQPQGDNEFLLDIIDLTIIDSDGRFIISYLLIMSYNVTKVTGFILS